MEQITRKNKQTAGNAGAREKMIFGLYALWKLEYGQWKGRTVGENLSFPSHLRNPIPGGMEWKFWIIRETVWI